MTTVSLVGAASYMPETVIPNSFFQQVNEGEFHPMFRGTRERRHVSAEESAVDMMVKACEKLKANLNLDLAKDADILLTNVTVLDMPFTGMGAELAHRLGMKPQWNIDMHNGGCVSFVFMMDLARALMRSSGAKTAIICNVSNAGGRIFNHPITKTMPQAAIPGDGCGVGYLVANDQSPIRSIVRHCYGEYARDMSAVSDDGQPWWAPRTTPMYIEFTESKLASVVSRANRIVPAAMNEAIAQADMTSHDIHKLFTNQPNRVFLRNWREAIRLKEGGHIHTFPQYGNLFGAGIPVSLAHAIENGLIQKGENLLLGGFAHAGDYAGAAVVQWGGGAST